MSHRLCLDRLHCPREGGMLYLTHETNLHCRPSCRRHRRRRPLRKPHDRAHRARRELVGRRQLLRHQHAVHGRQHADDRPAQGQLPQPVRIVPRLRQGPLHLVRTPVSRRDRRRRDPPHARRRQVPCRGGRGRRNAPRRLQIRRPRAFPVVRHRSSPALLLRAAVQHLDRAHLPPERERHPRIRALDAGERLPARHPHDRRHLAVRLRHVGVRPAPLLQSQGNVRRAPPHGLQGHPLDVPVRVYGLARIPPRRHRTQPRRRSRLPHEGRFLPRPRHAPARRLPLVERRLRIPGLHPPERTRMVQGAARSPRGRLRRRRIQARRRRPHRVHDQGTPLAQAPSSATPGDGRASRSSSACTTSRTSGRRSAAWWPT